MIKTPSLSARSVLLALFLPLSPLAFAGLPHAAEQQAPLPVTFFKNLKEGKPQTAVVYGTSLSHTAEWPKALKTYFDTQFPPGLVTFANAASSGKESNWGVANLKKRVLSQNPDLVIIEFSMNDSATKHGISVEKAIGNLDTMVTALRKQNPQVDVVLQTMNTVWDSPNVPEDKKAASARPNLDQYYESYRKYAGDHRLPLVDQTPDWKKLQEQDPDKFKRWIPDGTHPIPEASLAVTWANIKALLEKSRTAAEEK